jgi:hypothetical protein
MSRNKPESPQNRPTSKPHEDSPKKESTNRHVYIEPGAKIDLVQDLKNAYHTANEQTSAHNDKTLFWARIGAIFTILYVGLTGLIYNSSRQSAEAAVKAAKAAQDGIKNTTDQFHLDQRAWIGMQSMAIKIADPKDPIAGQAVVINTGKTFAFNCRVDVSMYFTDEEEDIAKYAVSPQRRPVPPDPLPNVGSIPPNMPRILDVNPTGDARAKVSTFDTKQGRKQLLELIRHKQRFIYLFGTVIYEDVFHTFHHTNFCGQYDPDSSGGFVACPTYNDAD